MQDLVCGLLLVFALSGITSCQGDADPCLNPSELETADWVTPIIEECEWWCCTCKTHLFSGKFMGKQIYFFETSGPLCDIAQTIEIRNCTGEIIKTYNGSEYQSFCEEVSERQVIIECQ